MFWEPFLEAQWTPELSLYSIPFCGMGWAKVISGIWKLRVIDTFSCRKNFLSGWNPWKEFPCTVFVGRCINRGVLKQITTCHTAFKKNALFLQTLTVEDVSGIFLHSFNKYLLSFYCDMTVCQPLLQTRGITASKTFLCAGCRVCSRFPLSFPLPPLPLLTCAHMRPLSLFKKKNPCPQGVHSNDKWNESVSEQCAV